MSTPPQFPASPEYQPPEYQAGYAPPQYPQQPAMPPKNGFGTTGFVLGLVGLLLSFLPIIGVVAWPLVILGLVFSILGLLRATKGAATNKGLAIAGIVLSAIGLVICIAWTALFGATVNAINNDKLHYPPNSGDAHTVEFVVTTNSSANVHYGSLTDQKQEVTPGGTASWDKKASFGSGSYLLSLTVDSTTVTADSSVSCSVVVDGKKVAENTGPGLASCTANFG
jgi:hypothetical protein